MKDEDQHAPIERRGDALPDASVVVVEHGTAGHLPACLDAILASRIGPRRLELIVVDNASPTPCEGLHARYPSVRFLHLTRNLGFAGGCALGMARARAPVVATVNPDAIVEPDWLARVLDAFAGDPRVGIVGAKLLEPDGVTIQHLGGRLLANGRSEHLGRGEPDGARPDGPREVDYVCGAALAVRREVLDAVGSFSPVYHPAYFEDAELCVRARAAGWRVIVEPRARARHLEASASGGARSDAYLRRYHTGRARFVARNVRGRRALWALPLELRLLAALEPRERRICARAWIRGLRSAWDPRAGRARPSDLVRDVPPRRASAAAEGTAA